ncbi:MAG: GNAT family N-acetyltransferase, partial [Anaerolineae bacterium]
MLAATQEAIAVKNNFTVRPVTMADVEAAVDLFNSCSRSQLGVDELELNEVKIEWQTPDFSLNNSTRAVFSAEGKLVGYVEVWDLKQPPVHPWVWGRVHPDFEDLGIGTFMMAWAGERARRAIARVPQGARVAMRSGSLSTHEPSKRLLQDLDMQLIRHFWDMKIEMEQAPPAP